MAARLVFAIAAFALAGCGGSTEGDIADQLGRDVSCREAGLIALAGEQETFYDCDGLDGVAAVGCFAVVDDRVYDVTEQVRRLGGGTVDC